MRPAVIINAYLLAADPAWIEESVTSYYDVVEKIIVSYDRRSLSWTGRPIAVDEAIDRVKSIDHDSKVVLSPGDYAQALPSPLDSETLQRQAALTQASEQADWVLQLDTDEVVSDQEALLAAVRTADGRAFDGVEFPLRDLYQHLRGEWYLEHSRRFWGVAAAYPGPVAVRGATRLGHCRQGPDNLYRVDFRPTNTDPHHPRDAPVHMIIRPDQAVMHYSWIRNPDAMRAKTQAWGHANDRDWEPIVGQWLRSQRQPWRSVLATPATNYGERLALRPTRIVDGPSATARAKNGLRS